MEDSGQTRQQQGEDDDSGHFPPEEWKSLIAKSKAFTQRVVCVRTLCGDVEATGRPYSCVIPGNDVRHCRQCELRYVAHRDANTLRHGTGTAFQQSCAGHHNPFAVLNLYGVCVDAVTSAPCDVDATSTSAVTWVQGSSS